MMEKLWVVRQQSKWAMMHVSVSREGKGREEKGYIVNFLSLAFEI